MTTIATLAGTDWEALRQRVLPGGYGRSSLAVGRKAPLAVRAAEHWIEDDQGTRLIDINNNMTVNLHGNAHPAIVAAVNDRLAQGLISLGLANTDELALAQLLVDRAVGWAEQVRFANSGTEAVMLAVRVARARTGRNLVIVHEPGYHGTADAVLPSMGVRGVRGVPAEAAAQTLVLPRGDIDALRRAFQEHGEQIAAVVIDLCANRGGLTELSLEYVEAAAQLTAGSGALLVVDEVVTYRNGYGGLVGQYGIRPDIAVLGKTIGGGFPIGAIIGSVDALSPLDPGGYALEHGGTFTANPITMAAGIAALELFDEAAVARLNALGGRLENTVGDQLAGTGWEFRRSGSVFRLWPEGWDAADRPAAQKALFWAQYERGLLGTSSGLSTLSTVMDEGIVDEIAAGLVPAARTVSPA